MNLTKTLFQNSVFYFAVFFAFTLWAFWPSYYSDPTKPAVTTVHIHGILMTGWCLLLIAQGALIRFKNLQLHRTLGKVSYVLVPAILASGISVSHYNVTKDPNAAINDFYYSNFGHMYVSLVAFALLYGLAMWYRKDSATHARYMLCTIFPAFTPVFSRIIPNNFGFVVPAFPTMDGVPLVQLVGFGLADGILITLCILDWQKRKRWQGFPIALIIILGYHLSDFTLYRFGLWRDFANWVIALPLS